MAMRIMPAEVNAMLATRRHRLRHFLWHAIRGAWNREDLTAEVKLLIKNRGWAPPDDRVPFDAGGNYQLNNHSGEDFLFMHREMIGEVNRILADLGQPAIDRWADIPDTASADFPIPQWTWADPNLTAAENALQDQGLQRVKSDAYLANPIQEWETQLIDPAFLKQISLGAYGVYLEFTIHNVLHMRWSSAPAGYMPSPNIVPGDAIDARWDQLDYDWLGDTYSSHLNPHFWYLHGWVDSCIDRWKTANEVDEIKWTGTWTGKLEDDWQDGDPVTFTKAILKDAELAMHGGHMGHGGHGGHGDHDIGEMEEIARALGQCGVIRNFYDILKAPPSGPLTLQPAV